MVLGLGQGQNFVASDVPALLEHTRDFVYMEEGDLAVITASSVDIYSRSGQKVNRPTRRIDWTPMMAEKGGHKHFMHKEIWEQPRAVGDTLRGRMLLSEGDVHFEGRVPLSRWMEIAGRTRSIRAAEQIVRTIVSAPDTAG